MGGGGGGGAAGGWWGCVLKPKQYARLSNEVIYKKATIYTMYSMWYKSLFKQNPYNSNFDSLVSEF